MHFNCGYFNHAYRALAQHILNQGTYVGPRGKLTKEVLGVSIRVNEPLNNILFHNDRKMNYKFMVAEFLWILYGYDDVETISKYNSKYVEYSDDGESLWGAYGPRLKVNIPYVISKLQEDRRTRQAVALIWETPWKPTKDVPCTLTLQFILRQDRLNLIVTMRSSDIWFGLPYDFYVFSQFLNLICYYTSSNPGFIQFNLGSSHVYENNLDDLQNMVAEYLPMMTFASDRIQSLPPAILANVLNDPDPEYWTGEAMPKPWETFKNVLIHPRANALSILNDEP